MACEPGFFHKLIDVAPERLAFAPSTFFAGERGSAIEIQVKDKLDPISILISCALMRFKEENSRLTYSNDLRVYIQQPSEHVCLTAVRTLKGQSHKDLSIINGAIEKAALWHQPHKAESNPYRTLFEKASEGLEPLRQTYLKQKDGEIIAGGISEQKSRICILLNLKDDPPKAPLDEKAQKVKDLWSLEDIERVNGLINQMEKKQGDAKISEKLLCADEIAQVNLLLEQKYKQLVKIWE